MKTTVVINKSQLELLKFIAKYRLVTVSQVQQNFGYKSRPSVNNKLKRLVTSGLVGMKYDGSKKMTGVPAVFYLTPRGLREVKKHLEYITEAIIHAAYSDHNASDALVEECGELFSLAKSLQRNYPNMKVLTARQLADIGYFPRPLPELYLAHPLENDVQRFFVFNLRDVKRYDIDLRYCIAKLIAYRESEAYAESGNEFPIIMLVCHSATIEKLAQRVMRTALNKSYESMVVYTTSYQALAKLQGTAQPIWSSIDDPETLLTLEEIEA
mgnify:CR=1 FL=1